MIVIDETIVTSDNVLKVNVQNNETNESLQNNYSDICLFAQRKR